MRQHFRDSGVRVANVIPALTLGAARVVAYRGETYTLRRLRFVDGLALHGAFTDLARVYAMTEPTDEDNVLGAAQSRRVTELLGSLLTPLGTFPARVRSEPVSFLTITWPEMHDVLRQVLALPDEMPPIVGASQATGPWDALDALLSFVARYPAWVTRRGYPLSWAHFLAGLAHSSREAGRAFLAQYGAAAAAQSGGEPARQMIEQARVQGRVAA